MTEALRCNIPVIYRGRRLLVQFFGRPGDVVVDGIVDESGEFVTDLTDAQVQAVADSAAEHLPSWVRGDYDALV